MKLKKYLSLFCACLMIGLASCLFIGCGKDDNHIEVNEVTHSIFYAPFYAAINKGFFEDEGLTITLSNGQGSDVSMTALLSGDADIILAGPETVVYSSKTKDSPKVFGQLTQKDGSFIVSKTDDQNFTLDMLRGKTIIGGRAGGLPAMTLQYVIQKAGLTIGTDTANGQVNLRTDVSFGDIASVYQTSNAEYCTLFEPTATAMVNQNKGHIVSTVGAQSGLVPYTCFIAKESYLKNKSDKAEKFLRAIMRGYEYVSTSNAAEVAKVLEPSFIGTSLADLEVAVKQYVAIDAWCSNPAMTETSYNKLVEIINNYKPTTAPTFADAVDNTIANKLMAA